jgi:group I intron endonuclease
MSVGIYKIENLVNGHCYIGQSIDIELRWRRHKEAVKKVDYPLYLAIRKYGIKNFSFKIVQECSVNELDEREIYWIKYYNSYYDGYNQTIGGSRHNHNVKISDEDLVIIIDLLRNSNMTQHEIAQIFDVGDDTISEINNGKTRVVDGVSYPIRKNKIDDKKCAICGKLICSTSTLCVSCNNEHMRVANRPSREELKHLLRLYSFTQLANEYGVSDNAIKKWCITYKLPHKKKDISLYSDDEWTRI